MAGTGTEVGKTWVSCQVLAALRSAGVEVAARKAAQSYAPGAGPTDADLLAGASGEDPDRVCPAELSFPVPMAPPMAAAALGRSVPDLASLAAAVRWPSDVGVGLVEGAGGLASPVAGDGDNLDLAVLVGADVLVLVAHPALGTINDVRLATMAVRSRARRLPVVVLLNRHNPHDALHRANLDWLAGREGLAVVTDPGALAARLRDGSFRPS